MGHTTIPPAPPGAPERIEAARINRPRLTVGRIVHYEDRDSGLITCRAGLVALVRRSAAGDLAILHVFTSGGGLAVEVQDDVGGGYHDPVTCGR